MNPFASPDRLLVSRAPQDMRCGIQSLAAKVAADFGGDPQDGAPYCFVSRDCRKMKMLRFDANGWRLYCCRLAEGCFRWEHGDGGSMLSIGRRELLFLLEGLDPARLDLPAPVAANTVL